MQWYLSTRLLQNSSNLVLLAFDEKKCFSTQGLLELVCITTPSHKRKCFINHHLLTTSWNKLIMNIEIPLYL